MKSTLLLIAFHISIIQPKITGLKKEYNHSNHINYHIHNDNIYSIYTNIALDVLIDNKWQEAISDITRRSEKTALVYKITNGTSKDFTFNLKDLDRVLFKNQHAIIRLKVYYGDSP